MEDAVEVSRTCAFLHDCMQYMASVHPHVRCVVSCLSSPQFEYSSSRFTQLSRWIPTVLNIKLVSHDKVARCERVVWYELLMRLVVYEYVI